MLLARPTATYGSPDFYDAPGAFSKHRINGIRRHSRAQLGLEMKPRSIRHLLFVTTHTPAVCAILITFAVGTSLPDVREQRGRRGD
jgi:hypothetical protein